MRIRVCVHKCNFLVCTERFYHATLCVSAVFAVGQSLSVTFMFCIQTADNIVKILSRPGILIVCEGWTCILRSATPPIPREEFPCSPIFGVLLYLCLHPSMHNDHVQHGNTYGEERVFRSSTTPLRLHRCVARFVSDS